MHQLGIPAEVPPDSEHTTKCALSPRFQGGGRALKERGWVWTLRGAHTEFWPPRCFSQNPSLVHRSTGLFPPFQEKLPDLCLQEEPEVMWDPGFCQPSPCHNRTSSSSRSDNGVPHSSMKAPQGSYFPADSPSSGVTLTGPPGHHVPTNLLLLKGRMSSQVPLSRTWR